MKLTRDQLLDLRLRRFGKGIFKAATHGMSAQEFLFTVHHQVMKRAMDAQFDMVVGLGRHLRMFQR